MQKKMATFTFFLLFQWLLGLNLVACTSNDAPEDVAKTFWSAVQNQKMETAKQMVTWQSAGSLKYLADERMRIKRFEFGEIKKGENLTEIETMLVMDRKDGDNVRIPTQTVLVFTEGVWRVNLKSTISAVVKESVNKFANKFEQLMREGLQELDKALSNSMEDISESLEEGAKELGDSLEEGAKEFSKSMDELKKELEKRKPKKYPDSPSEKHTI